jgi:predicted extracellular nuclease
MKDFKVGDIVRVYGNVDTYYLRGDSAEITHVTFKDEITVIIKSSGVTNNLIATVHPKQCRMLERRKPCKKCGK